MAGDEGYGSPAPGPSAPFTANVPLPAAPTAFSLFKQKPQIQGNPSSSGPNPPIRAQPQASIGKSSTSSRAFKPGVLPNSQLSTAPGSAARLAGLSQPTPPAQQEAPVPRPSASASPFPLLANIQEVSEPPTSPAHRTRSQVLERERQASSPAPEHPSSSPGPKKEKHRSSKKKTPAASQQRMHTRNNSASAVAQPSPLTRASLSQAVSFNNVPVPEGADKAPSRPPLSSKNVNIAQAESTQRPELVSNKRKADILQAETSNKPKSSLARTFSAASSSETVTGDGDESSRSGPSPNKRVRRSVVPRLTDSSSLLPPVAQTHNTFAEKANNATGFGSASQPQPSPHVSESHRSTNQPVSATASPEDRGRNQEVLLLQKQKAQALLARPTGSIPVSTTIQASTSANAPLTVRASSRAASPQRQLPPKQPATPSTPQTDARSALVNDMITLLSNHAKTEALHDSSQNQIKYMAAQTASLQQEIERLRASKDEYKQQASDRQALAASKIDLEGRIVLLKDDVKTTEKKLEETVRQIYSEALAMLDDYLFSNNMVTEENVDALSKAFSDIPATTAQASKLHAFKKLVQAGVKFVEEWYEKQAAETAAADTSVEVIANLKKQIEQGLQTAATLKTELTLITSDKSTSEKEVARLEGALVDAQAELKAARELSATLTNTFDTNVAKLREDLKTVQQSLNDERLANIKKESELQGSTDDLISKHISAVHDLESKHSSSIAKKTEQVTSLTQQIAVLETKLANAEANFKKESDREKASASKAEETILNLRAKVGSKQLDVVTLQTERDDVLTRLNLQSLEHKAAQDKIAALEAAAATSSASNQDNSIPVETAERGLLSILTKLVEIDGLAGGPLKNPANKSSLEELQQLISTALITLKGIVVKLVTQRDESRAALTTASAAATQSQDRIIGLEKNITSLQAQLQMSESGKDRLHQEVQVANKALEESASQLASSQIDVSEQKAQAVQRQVKVETLTTQLQEKETSLATQIQKAEDIQKKLDLQRDQHSGILAERNLMSSQLDTIRSELSTTQVKYHEALSSAAVANSEIKVYNATIVQKDQELSARKDQWAKLESLQADITSRDEQISDIQEQLTAKQGEISDLSASIEQERQKWLEESKLVQEEARQAGFKADLQIKNIQEQSKKELSMKENDYKKLTRKFNDLQARHAHLQEERNREKNRPTIPQDSSPMPENAIQGSTITTTQIQTQTVLSRDKPPSRSEGIKQTLALGQPLNRPRSSEVSRVPSIPLMEGNSSLTDQGDDSEEEEAGEANLPSKMTENILQALTTTSVASQSRTTRSSSKRAQSATTGDDSRASVNKSDDEESGVKKRRRL